MVRFSALCVACGMLWVMSYAQAGDQSTKFPQISTKNLNDRSATFPSDLPGRRTFVLVAFKREQQADLDVWISKLGLNKTNSPAWIEMPVVTDYGSIWRAFVDNGMRSGIKTKTARSRVFTVYGNRDKFLRKLKMPTADKVYLLVVQQDGKILARVDGRYSDKKSNILRDALAAD